MTPHAQPAAVPAVSELKSSAPTGETSAGTRRRRLPLVFVVVGLVVVAAARYRWVFAPSSSSSAIIAVSGRIEADEAAVAPKLSGRILEVRLREGDTVKTGDVNAVLDDEQVRARENQTAAALSEAEAR